MNNSYDNECPDCGTPNFTPAGLKSHRGGKNCQKRRDELIRHLSESSITGGPFQRALRILPSDILRKVANEAMAKNDHNRENAIFPYILEREKTGGDAAALPIVSDTPSAPDEAQDKTMGEQLTSQYEKAVGGMREVVLFGAMMLKLQHHLAVSTRGHGGKFGDKGDGMKGWLDQYAPNISRATAYRFMSVAEAVQAEFKLPAKVQKNLGFSGLITAKPEELSDDLRKKQLELFEFVDGTSQRSWLDKLSPRKPLGGARPRKEDDAKKEGGSDINSPAQIATDIWKPLIFRLQQEGLEQKSWADLPKDQLLTLKGVLIDLNKELNKIN